MPQVRIGWRSGTAAAAAPSVSATLLDSYSGAAAAYSLRKLRTGYTGSAIRVRRSSDNTEQNIGFDSDGNLDTYALSTFVGTGNGFVTTWYDQSGNSRDAFQTSAINQPQIVSGGSILLENGKPTVSFTTSHTLATNSLNLSFYDCTISYVSRNISRSAYACGIFGYGTNGQSSQIRYLGVVGNTLSFIYYGADFWSNFSGMGDTKLTLYSLNFQSNTVNFYKNNSTQTGSQFSLSNTSSSRFTINDIYGRGEMANINFSEGIFYTSGKSDVINDIRSNQNIYYSVYPNPTSVWNLLAAAYNADTTASSSLKTSLVASYNGESNTNDSKGTNNGTAVGGLTYVTGKIGNAFQFNGSTSYVSLPNDSLNFTGDFTVNAWFNTSTYTGLRGIASSYKVVGSLAYGWIAYHEDVTNQFALYFRDGSNTMLYRTNGGIPANSYYMITWVRKVGQDPKIYINGVLSPGAYTFGNSSSNPSYQTGQPCNLGGWNNTSYGNHKQDATNFWSKALTISEITELYNSGNGAQYIGDNFYKPTTNDALNTYNGTAQGGLTYGLGKVGTAFSFNGTNAYVELGDVMDVGTSSWSYTFWFKTFDAVNSGICFSKSFAGGNSGRFWGGPYNNRFAWNFQAGSNVICTETNNGTILPNTWYHVVCVLDRNDKLKLYINGTLASVNVTSGTNNLTPYLSDSFNTTHPFRIGAYTDSNNITPYGFFKGQIDSFSVWNRVLTQSEVTELYNSGNGKQYPN